MAKFAYGNPDNGIQINDIISMFGKSTRSMRREDLQNQQPELNRQHVTGLQDSRQTHETGMQGTQMDANRALQMLVGDQASERQTDSQNFAGAQAELEHQLSVDQQLSSQDAAKLLQQLVGEQAMTRQTSAQEHATEAQANSQRFTGGQNAADNWRMFTTNAANNASAEARNTANLVGVEGLRDAQAQAALANAGYSNELTAGTRNFRTGGAPADDGFGDMGDLKTDTGAIDATQALEAYLNQDVTPLSNLRSGYNQGFSKLQEGFDNFAGGLFRTPREKEALAEQYEQHRSTVNDQLGGDFQVDPGLMGQLPPELLQMLAEGTLEGSKFSPEVILQLIQALDQQ